MLENKIWSLPGDQLKVWFTIISKANYKESHWDDGTRTVVIPVGSCITSQDKLAEIAKVGRQTVRTAIRNLIRLESISTKIVTNRYTIINVINWPIYNTEESQPNQQPNQQPTNSQPTANHALRRRRSNTLLPLAIAPGNGHDPRVKELVLYWYAGCERERKFKAPETWAKDGALIKTMLRGRESDEVKFCLDEFLARPPTGFGRQDAGRFSGKCTLQAVLMCMDQLLQRRKVDDRRRV